MSSDNVPGRTSARTLRTALIASLALNVLIIGGVASAMIVARYAWKGHAHRNFGLISFADTLPAGRAEVVRNLIADKEKGLAPLRQAEREAKASARAALMANPFDAARFRSALAHAGDADASEKRARLDILADTAEVLTQDERLQLHNWFEERRRKWRRNRDASEQREDAAKPAAAQDQLAPASAE
jgi:uncharacterized membrane protein